MERFVKGDVVVIPFPFSDLTGQKKRPAIVLASLPGNDIILCQITSRFKKDKFAIALSPSDFTRGGLPVLSYIRANRIFTADKNIILRKAGTLNRISLNSVITRVISIIES